MISDGYAHHPEWICTIAYYRAMHYVHAVLVNENKNGLLPATHHDLKNFLRSTRKYSVLYNHIRILHHLSDLARYARDQELLEHMQLVDIEKKAIGHHLW